MVALGSQSHCFRWHDAVPEPHSTLLLPLNPHSPIHNHDAPLDRLPHAVTHEHAVVTHLLKLE
jgi:hypothetical protein